MCVLYFKIEKSVSCFVFEQKRMCVFKQKREKFNIDISQGKKECIFKECNIGISYEMRIYFTHNIIIIIIKRTIQFLIIINFRYIFNYDNNINNSIPIWFFQKTFVDQVCLFSMLALPSVFFSLKPLIYHFLFKYLEFYDKFEIYNNFKS